MSEMPERVRRARLQLMLRHPFLANATARLPLVEVEPGGWCDTAATDGYRIYWSRAFFDRLDEAQIGGVLAHEMLHVVLGHRDRRGAREPELWNEAIDHATNLLVLDAMRMRLPHPHLARRAFRDMTAETIYDLLAADRRPRPAPLGQAGGGDGAGHGRGGAPARAVPRIGAARRRALAQGKARAAGAQPQPAVQAPAQAAPPRVPDTEKRGFDHHLDPGDPRAGAAGEAAAPSPVELGRLRHDLLRDLREGLAGGGHGHAPGEIMEAIQRAARARAPWQALLARCVGGIRRDDYRLMPPSRRHLWRGIMLPSLGVPGPRSIVCAIDTSGSIDRALASRFLAEVHALRCSAQCRLHVVQCDAGITDHRVYEGWEAPPRHDGREKFKGGGGTDFRPVFDLVARAIIPSEGPPDLLAYMTDAIGTFPEKAPRWPVVWLLPEGSRAQTPFGMRIEVPPR